MILTISYEIVDDHVDIRFSLTGSCGRDVRSSPTATPLGPQEV
ncbi:hypothetical protein [Streptomyces sulfonofaciens]|nr:hypothetical protein [Streptomyces sulfonofaciens]